MEDEKFQKELFEFEKPKRFFPRLSDFFPKADFERNVVLTLTLDRAVFIAIGIIMVMVAVYALGVEKGKTGADEGTQAQAIVESQMPPSLPAPAIVTAKNVQPLPVVRAAVPVAPARNAAPAIQVKSIAPAAQPAKPYTVVAATFAQKGLAVQEMDKLRKKGFDAFLMQSDRYSIVCIGAYPDRAGALVQKDLKKVKRLYKDAYVRLR
ncbi:MAG: SPOR domain-containing protein [Candidatus Omnitrophica bacterium]|nr:SPOR domain-containing protein [Candidatus Omnitrophota bacterium]